MTDPNYHTPLTVGTVSGTILAALGNIHNEDILKTIILATIGAIISFSVSVIMKWLQNQLK